MRYVAEKLAKIFSPLTADEIGRITDVNTRRLFRLPHEESGRIAYVIGNSLYLNITNQCSNNCFFCAKGSDYLLRGYNLKLAYEPSEEEIVAAVGDSSRYDEVVFCGFGEPTYRLDTLIKVARHLKNKGARLRLNTNGQGSLINGRDISTDLAPYFDRISVSLNAPTKERYNRICKPQNPEKAFEALLEFTRNCRGRIPEVTLSIVEIPRVEIEACRSIADQIGVPLRIREFHKAH